MENFALLTAVSDQEKEQVWQAYRARRPTRVPVLFNSNPRVVVLNPAWNTGRWCMRSQAQDPRVHVEVALQHALYCRRVLGRHSDMPAGLPDVWTISYTVYNIYEAAFFGAEVELQPDQVPCTKSLLTDDNRQAAFAVDVDHPLDNSFIQRGLKFWQEMAKICADLKFEGRPVQLMPWRLCGSDGPVTVACNLRGVSFLEELLAEPDYAQRLMERIMQAAIQRRRAFWQYWGDRIERTSWMADDSIALLSSPLYVEKILPLHRRWYDAADADCGAPLAPRAIHLCGDATRHFAAIHQKLNVTSFDTGFPVDHARLRGELGPEVELLGGPEVALLLDGTPEQVFARTRDILGSGVKQGGRFVLQEANNLPPNVPEKNLAALYAACLEFGRYES